jgi:hypothetical protein
VIRSLIKCGRNTSGGGLFPDRMSKSGVSARSTGIPTYAGVGNLSGSLSWLWWNSGAGEIFDDASEGVI